MPATITFEVRGKVGKIEVPLSHGEITYSAYIDYVKCRERYYKANVEEAEALLNEAEGHQVLPPPDSGDAEAVDHMAQALGFICPGDIGLIPATLPGDELEVIPPLTEGLSLARIFAYIENLIYGYIPEFDITKRDYVLEYEGEKYVMKAKDIESVESGVAFETVEVVEVNMIYQLLAKAGDDPDGAKAFEADLKMMAILMRKPEEHVPIKKVARDKWVENRARHFSGLPMTAVLDVSFFFSRTLNILKTSRRISRSLKESQTSQPPGRKMRLRERLRRNGASRHTRNM